jgi:hypothetical protein
MQARLTTKPEQDVIAAIHALELESVKLRVMDPKLGEGWTREYADSIETAYKTYLTMLVKYQDHAEDILLSEDVDEFWHTHILQTFKYADDCQNVFGKFLHHAPHVGEVTAEDIEKRVALAETTRALYEREFGSARNAGAAWSGIPLGAKNAASSDTATRFENAAMSAAFIGKGIAAENAAMSAAFIGKKITAENAAMSAAFIGRKITAGNAAMSAAFISKKITAENAAMSAAFIGKGIAAEHAAMSAAFIGKKITAENAAMSAAFVGKGITAENAAMSAAFIGAKNADLSLASAWN